MTADRQPLVRYHPIEPVWADLRAWVGRHLLVFPDRTDLWNDVEEVPGEAVGRLLRSHLIGEWDLEGHEVAHLWFIGRAMGWRRQQLLPDDALAQALPGRGVRPDDPPGRWVRDLLLWGGGHGPGKGKPGAREFPAHWSDDRVIEACVAVARNPDGAVELPDGTLRAVADVDGGRLGVVVDRAGRLRTGYPIAGEGVVQNPPSAAQAPWVALLWTLLESLPAGDEPRTSLEELHAVGEWPSVLESLLVMDVPWTESQRGDLEDLAEVSGLDLPGGWVSRTG